MGRVPPSHPVWAQARSGAQERSSKTGILVALVLVAGLAIGFATRFRFGPGAALGFAGGLYLTLRVWSLVSSVPAEEFAWEGQYVGVVFGGTLMVGMGYLLGLGVGYLVVLGEPKKDVATRTFAITGAVVTVLAIPGLFLNGWFPSRVMVTLCPAFYLVGIGAGVGRLLDLPLSLALKKSWERKEDAEERRRRAEEAAEERKKRAEREAEAAVEAALERKRQAERAEEIAFEGHKNRIIKAIEDEIREA